MDVLLARVALNKGEETYLDALSDLVGTYEDEHHAIEPASDAEMLQHLLDAKGMTQAKNRFLPKCKRDVIHELFKSVIHKIFRRNLPAKGEAARDPEDCRKIRKKPAFCLFAKRRLLQITYCGQFPKQTEKLREPLA